MRETLAVKGLKRSILLILTLYSSPEAYLEPCQASMMMHFAKIVQG